MQPVLTVRSTVAFVCSAPVVGHCRSHVCTASQWFTVHRSGQSWREWPQSDRAPLPPAVRVLTRRADQAFVILRDQIEGCHVRRASPRLTSELTSKSCSQAALSYEWDDTVAAEDRFCPSSALSVHSEDIQLPLALSSTCLQVLPRAATPGLARLVRVASCHVSCCSHLQRLRWRPRG